VPPRRKIPAGAHQRAPGGSTRKTTRGAGASHGPKAGPATAKRAPRAKGGTGKPNLPRLYDDLAWLWPILSPPDHYADEAATLREEYARVAPKRRKGRPRLLELGAGGGHLLGHLISDFECTAADLAPAMLDNCARLVPEARRILGDMRTLRLDERFDVVLIHDAIDYMASARDVRAALATAAAHLEPGGVLFVAPTYTRDNFTDGESDHDADPSANLTYLSYVHDPDPSDTEYELVLVYLIRDARTRAVEATVDRHRCGLFAESEWLSFLAEARFSARQVEDEKAWTLFAATKRRAATRGRK
jgi:SAM-dependent methyltransferase